MQGYLEGVGWVHGIKTECGIKDWRTQSSEFVSKHVVGVLANHKQSLSFASPSHNTCSKVCGAVGV